MTTAKRVVRLYPPEVEPLEPRTTWKQKSPQLGVGIMLLWGGLGILLSRQLSLLSLLEFFLEIGLVTGAGHRLLNAEGDVTEMWRLWRWCR